MLAESGVAAEVADAECQSEGALGGGDLGDALQTARGLDQSDDRDVGQPLGGLSDVVDRFHHRQHHPADRAAGEHRQVVGPELGAETVDANPVVVAVRQPAHHVLPGGRLAFWGHRILDIEDDDVGAGPGRGGELVVLGAVDQQPASGQHRVDAGPGILEIDG